MVEDLPVLVPRYGKKLVEFDLVVSYHVVIPQDTTRNLSRVETYMVDIRHNLKEKGHTLRVLFI